ncbi:alpha-L-fucosidase [Schaalia odontolytica]|uniref:alpha-L-fucosidase n=2 Tax=Schaalia odontolytica TaxID=1660 RepID=A0A857A536_9ACTO|nr:alpha-L-fucosidase [Schaalia odontolytica]EFF81018.1 LPXTG-motif cell wall anchor domain protein [Schaalia odontolytica F0309]QGS10390.1 alpha-L-fucosidase [Schaalia odontolytica]
MHITKRVAGTLLAGLLTLGMAGPALADTPTADGAQSGTPAPQATYDARYAIPAAVAASSEAKVSEWQDMKYAMFIHWGVYSSYAGWYKGQKQEVGYPEQIKAWGHQQTWDSRIPLQGIPREEYLATAQTFEAPNFDATAWCQQAKDTGMKMLLITSKHHDGFAMWDTATTDYNFTKQSPSHRDPLLELSQACKQVGIKFGLYFSNIDWEKQPENPWQNANTLDEEGYMEYIHAQLKELLGGKYGEIAELWYDMGKPNPAQSDQLRKWAHELQPNIMINSRVGNDRADFEVGWDNEMQSEQTQGPWESAVSIFHKTWGYANWDDAAPKFKDTGYPDYPNWDHMINVDNTTALRKAPGGAHKKTTEIVGNMFSTVALGGQFLFNVGPKFDGSYDPWDASVLKGIGDWNRAHPGILNNSRPTHFPIESWGKTMVDDSHIYMGIEKWPADGVITLRGAGANDISSVKLDGSDAALTYKVEGNDLVITLPAQPDEILPVVTATTNGAPNYVPTGLTTIGTEATTIPASGLEKFKAPTPKTGETSFTASITSGDQIASGVSVSFDTEGFTDAYAKYKVSVDGQVIKGLTVAELKEGVGPFAIGANQTARVTLEYDNPAYVLKGFGKDTTVKSVTVKAEKLSTPAVTVKPSTVEAGKTITVKGTGFAPESAVTLTLHSEPVEVGTATVDENGAFSAEVTVPANTEAGDHTVVAESTSPAVTASAPLTVTAPAVPSAEPSASPSVQPSAAPAPAPEQGGKGGLARTGTNALIVVAGALIAAGVGTVLIRRSRLTKA